MSDTPNNVEGDAQAPTLEPPAGSTDGSLDAVERRRAHDIWVTGTEEPDWIANATDEGAQELLPRDIDPALHQFGELFTNGQAQAGTTKLAGG